MTATALPPIGRPAMQALAAAGLHTLEDVRAADPADLAALHGVGPKAMRLLQEALAAEDPRPRGGADPLR
jgi:hypothetical protein